MEGQRGNIFAISLMTRHGGTTSDYHSNTLVQPAVNDHEAIDGLAHAVTI